MSVARQTVYCSQCSGVGLTGHSTAGGVKVCYLCNGAGHAHPTSIPHKCPVCSGKGKVSAGFYSTTADTWTTSTTTPESCRACTGSGVIWSAT